MELTTGFSRWVNHTRIVELYQIRRWRYNKTILLCTTQRKYSTCGCTSFANIVQLQKTLFLTNPQQSFIYTLDKKKCFTSTAVTKSSSEQDMIKGWYRNLTVQNKKRNFMLDTGHLFELHPIEKFIPDGNVLHEIRSKQPTKTYSLTHFLLTTIF